MIPHNIEPRFKTTVYPDGNVTSVQTKPFDKAQYAAEQCGRQEVTVDWYVEHGFDHDMQLFRWVEGASDYGLDPWRLVDGPYDVKPETRIFVQVKDLQKAGIAIPGKV